MLGWPEYQSGQIAVIFATLFVSPLRHKHGDWDILTYADPEEAHAAYSAQLDAYYRLVDEYPDKFRLVQSLQDLQLVLTNWSEDQDEEPPVGLVILMEGADGVRQPDELEEWIPRVNRLKSETERVFLITNNHFGGKAFANALEMQARLSGKKVKAPEEILQAFPDLKKHVLDPPGQSELF